MKVDAGWIPLVLLYLLLGVLGIFGKDCQHDLHSGIRSTVRAFQDKE